MILAARGITDGKAAGEYLRCDAPLVDPFRMTDMDKAVGRVARAITQGETIAVFGDYDVDGITATCLLTDFLRSCGANCNLPSSQKQKILKKSDFCRSSHPVF